MLQVGPWTLETTYSRLPALVEQLVLKSINTRIQYAHVFAVFKLWV